MKVFTPVHKRKTVILKQGDARVPARNIKETSRNKDLLDAWHYHSWLRAALSVVGRSLIGPGISMQPIGRGSTLQKRRIWDFINSYGSGDWDSIKDYYTPSAKLYITAVMIKLFGSAAWEVVRNENGKAIGYDVIFGTVTPNVDKRGRFKFDYDSDGNVIMFGGRPVMREPAFTQKLGSSTYSFEDPKDVIYFLWPDANGSVTGGSDIDSLLELVIPADLYAQSAYRNLHKNQSTPDGIWITDPAMEDDMYEEFVAQVDAKYKGQANFGKAFITAKGDVDFKSIVQPRDDAPYLEGRSMSRDETSAVTGVPGAKMGLTSSMTRAGMREVQRFFHESTMVPLFRFMEEVLYNQVCIREFNSPGWKIVFNSPDFMTSLEKATVAQRYWSTGSLSANEIRTRFLGEAEREGGDEYFVPANVSGGTGRELTAPSPNARAGAADSGVPTADYVGDESKPLRADKMIRELRDWRRVEKRIMEGKRFRKEFECHEVPPEMAQSIRDVLELAETVDDINEVFAEIISEVESVGRI